MPAHAALTFKVRNEHGRWTVAWTKRNTEPRYPSDQEVRHDIGAWAASRQACSASVNESPELTGVIGLASELCHTKGKVEIGQSISGFDDLDDPEPVLDTFGGGAPGWARVVAITAPVPMRVVAAPLGDHWIAVAVDRPSPPQ